LVFAQADLEEHEEHGCAQPGRDQGNREDLACDSSHERGAHTAGEDECGG
jgi:hypothetical protein